MRRFLLVAVMCGAASVAQAADMPDLPFLRGSFTDGLSSARVNWQGFYVGGQASYGSTTSKLSPTANSDLLATLRATPTWRFTTTQWPLLATPTATPAGFGGFVGYNSQWEDVVLGVEANYIHDGIRSVSDATGSRGIMPTGSINSLTSFERGRETLRLRLAARPRRLRHGMLPALRVCRHRLGQPDRRSHRFGLSGSAVAAAANDAPPARPSWFYGYSAGVGIDVMLVGGLFMRAEYEYRRVTSDIETNINTVRAGLGYKF